jgi:hypothetical protein
VIRRLPARLVALSLVVGAVGACAALFDDPIQCATDADCDRFDAVCDVSQSVCVPRIKVPVPGRDGGPGPNEDGGDDDATSSKCPAGPKPSSPIGATKIGNDGGPVSEVTGALTLDCSQDWILEGHVFVRANATLTIEAGTTIVAKKGTNAAIVIDPGAKIVANGERDLPIVLTSDGAPPAAGDWRGLFVLGLAPPAGQGPFEGDPALPWGGVNADDSSGSLTFVRVEYAENGAVFAGAGRKTKVDSIQVRKTVQNCFFFYGGTVDAKHLVCQYPGDEQFDTFIRYSGRLQFLFGQKTGLGANVFNKNGFLVDEANPVVYNATLCGDTAPNNGYGLVFRDGAKMDMSNLLMTGWFAGLDATGAIPAANELRGSLFFGNATNPAYVEDPAEVNPDLPTFNDDEGFDEIAFVRDPARANKETDPGLVDCHDPKAPKPWPKAAITAGARTPPDDGFFDSKATYVGAFRDGNDPWMKGTWVRFDDK